MLSVMKKKITSLLQLMVVIIYILFEELIWEGIAKPIYTFIHSLKVLQKVEEKLHSANASVILVIFVLLFGIVEALGIYAGILFVSGQILLGISLYISKIPIAAFTFWVFRITEDKLMQFGWFKWIYDWIVFKINWLKSRDTYRETMAYWTSTKAGIKKSFKLLKEKYFSKESLFVSKIKYLYTSIKASLKK